MSGIYFDHNATTWIEPKVITYMAEIMAAPNNPSSIHRFGREASMVVEKARKRIKQYIHADQEDQVIFTATGTEANNLALANFKERATVISAVEHASIFKNMHSHVTIPVDHEGQLSLKALDNILRHTPGKLFVSVMLANNETGVVYPVKEICDLAHQYHAVVHTDAVQAAGKIPVYFNKLGVDMMTIAAHKLGGPQGAAALIAKKSLVLKPFYSGGGQEKMMRPGTENVAAIGGFGLAMEIASKTKEQYDWIKTLRDQMEDELITYTQRKDLVCAKQAERLPNTSCIAMPGVNYETQVMHFDMENIAISAGSACSSGRIEPSHVLKAMQIPQYIRQCAIRVSLGKKNTVEEMKRFVAVWKELYTRLVTHQKIA